MPERNAKVRRRLAAGKLRLRIRDLRNLGPRAESLLAAIGIVSADALRARGALDAYLALRRAGLAKSINLLWALVGALEPWPEGRDAREVAEGPSRLALLLAVERSDTAQRAVRGAARAAHAEGEADITAIEEWVPGSPFTGAPKRKNRRAAGSC
jgi:DNA transformation protein